MKKKLNLRNVVVGTICLAGILVFLGCDKEPNSNGNNNNNYWEQNSLIGMQLKGKVKTITQDGTTISFDENGRIVSVENEWNGKRDYVYNANGQLIDDGEHTYAYNVHGKYVPKHFFHWNDPNMGGLVQNLKSITAKEVYGNNFLYIFDGNTLKMTINQGTDSERIIEIAYEGNYPKGYETEYDVVSAKYAANGMFTQYYEAFKNFEDGTVSFGRTYFYKQDGNFMLLDKKTDYTASYNGQPATSTTTYTYNDKKDFEKEVLTDHNGITYETTYSYVYDSNGNWTKKTVNYTDGSYENDRTITYY